MDDWLLFWTAVYAIATVVLVLGVIFTFFQLREVRKGRNSQLAAQLYQSFRTKEVKETLSKVYHAASSNPEAHLTKEEMESILDNVSLVGLLVAQGILDKTLAIRVFGHWSIRCWSRLSSYVERIRRERGGYYSRYLEDFAKRSIKYYIEHDPKDQWIYLTIEGKNKENLVEDLKEKLLSKRELCIANFKRTLRSAWNPSLRK